MRRSLQKGTNERPRPRRAPPRRTSSVAPRSQPRPSVARRLLSRRPVRLHSVPAAGPPSPPHWSEY
eukprot:309532-Prymnesium_polylepis.1